MSSSVSDAPALLAGVRVVEISSFVAAPLCGLTLAQLGAEVIRIDPVGGAADVNRWPVTDSGLSIYWTGLNRGKQSVVLDLRSDAGRETLRHLITAPGEGGGIVVTNAAGRAWMSHDVLQSLRQDVITLEILGRHDGRAGVDYTVNAGMGFPSVTGPTDSGGVVNHVLPTWDVACGLYAALSIVTAVRRREREGVGAQLSLALDDVALALSGTLGFLTEPQVTERERPAIGNGIYGTFGRDFRTGDGGRFMIVALTPRHFRDLVEVTGTTDVIKALELSLGADFDDESVRYRHREVLSSLFETWFRSNDSEQVENFLRSTSVLYQRYRTFAEVAASPDVVGNPLFEALEQPGIGTYLAAALPVVFDGRYLTVGAAPQLGAATGTVLGAVSSGSA